MQSILAERLRRQRLLEPLANRESYVELFALLQPVASDTYSRPGSPPRLVHRTTFGDHVEADRLRAKRGIVKARFLGGAIGYVLAKDLDLYANAFHRPLSQLSHTQQAVLDTVVHQGPITPRLIKEETGLLNKRIMPALHRLQQAFLVYEDQVDEDWERGWYDFAAEWPEAQVDEARRESASAAVLRRFIEWHVFAMEQNLKDWSAWPARKLTKLLGEMESGGQIVAGKVEGLGGGWMLPKDVFPASGRAPPTVFMLHRSDVLVRSHTTELKRRFGGREVLQYLLIDGRFQGAVLGHWRIGPHDVEDIVVELAAREREARREEVLQAVRWGYRPPHSNILRYGGAGQSVRPLHEHFAGHFYTAVATQTSAQSTCL
jgi:hypothetical protein